ncbi:MAG: hypothetical protein LBU34_16385, partial [Planctomycetaceae bacterium]|nr:hypothetical protein [Planctomycetaceae bacterium]
RLFSKKNEVCPASLLNNWLNRYKNNLIFFVSSVMPVFSAVNKNKQLQTDNHKIFKLHNI